MVRDYSIPYFVKNVESHDLIKHHLLSIIENDVGETYNDITKSDWMVPREKKREYMSFFLTFLRETLQGIYEQNNLTFEIKNFWYQQYEQNDKHDWHTHPDCNYSSVYYLELPDDEVATQFLNPVTGEIFTPDVKEGDMITFPGTIIHRSPVNNTGKRKTVIVCNTTTELQEGKFE